MVWAQKSVTAARLVVESTAMLEGRPPGPVPTKELLLPLVRSVVRMLGLVAGADVSSPAAAALAGTAPAEAPRLLDRLHAACLAERPGPDRYACHDLLRLYAGELAESAGGDERGRAVERLDRWYLRSAEAAAELLYPQMARLPAAAGPAESPPPFHEPAQALAWLAEEWSNLGALVRSAAERRAPAAWRLSDALRGYMCLSRRLAGWPAIGEAALRAAEAAGDAGGQAAAHFGIGSCLSLAYQFPAAIEHLDEALTAAREADWLAGQAAITGSLSVVHRYLGRFRESRACLDETLALARRCGWTDGEATALGNLGFGYLATGPLQTAVAYLTQAIELHRRRGHREAAGMFLGALADACRLLGRTDEAYERVWEALALLRSVGDRGSEASGLTVLAHTHRQAGRPAEAAACAAEAAAIGREAGDLGVRMAALNALGAAKLALGSPEAAAAQHHAALALARQGRNAAREVEAILGLAAADRRGTRHATAALIRARACGSRLLEGEALGALAAAALACGASEEAAELAGQALSAHQETGHHVGRLEAMRLLEEARCRLRGPVTARPVGGTR
jgi:tetratricopeptide (TPR) repeat protein